MIERVYIHVGGPQGSGKTTFIEAVLSGAGAEILAARCVRDEKLREGRETRPKTDPEIRRYRQAGAIDAARFDFPDSEMEMGSDAFFMTELMSNCSQAVIVEGKNPLAFVDLDVFIAPAPKAGERLLVRRTRDMAANDRATMAAWERQLSRPGGVADWLNSQVGGPAVEFARKKPEHFDSARDTLLAHLAQARNAPAREPVEYWAVTRRYAGIEKAGLVVINVHHDRERAAADRLGAEVERLRKDEEVLKDVLSFRGHRIPITIVPANLGDPRDPGLRKALARVRRAVRARTS